MKRNTMLVTFAAAAFAGAGAWYLAENPGEPAVALATATPANDLRLAQATAAAPANPMVVSPVSSETVAKWIADSNGGDAAKRAAAIAALAGAPRADALPVLGRILTNGEPQVDRPLALRSLRDLAVSQGDADGAIRDAVRQAIYHGDDHTDTNAVQEVLDIIEESELR